MANIIIFGAGGRAGRAAVAEALSRGHQVTAVVRDPAKYSDLGAAGPTSAGGASGTRGVSGATVMAGDVTDADSVATLAVGHDAVIHAAGDLTAVPGEFFTAAARALVSGLTTAGVNRLVAVGIGTVLEAAPGVPIYTTEGFPAEHRAFSEGHATELPVFAGSMLDWLVVAPPPVFLSEAVRTGKYRLGGALALPNTESFSYADLAVALVDQIEEPTRHRELVGLG
jgi:putative NADH-flavin reductase